MFSLMWTGFSGERCSPWASCLSGELDLLVWHIVEKFKLNNQFSKVSARVLIYHMSISCDLSTATCIKKFVLVKLAIFGIGHYWGHLCFRNTTCYMYLSNLEFVFVHFFKIISVLNSIIWKYIYVLFSFQGGSFKKKKT